jgi:hypothetical protein
MFQHRVIGNEYLRRILKHFFASKQPVARDRPSSQGFHEAAVLAQHILFVCPQSLGLNLRGKPPKGHAKTCEMPAKEWSYAVEQLVVSQGIHRVDEQAPYSWRAGIWIVQQQMSQWVEKTLGLTASRTSCYKQAPVMLAGLNNCPVLVPMQGAIKKIGRKLAKAVV